MLKKSLALVLSLAVLLSAMSGLALFASAETVPFAYASFVSGQPLYKNDSGKNLDSVSEKGGATEMAPITGDDADRYAHFMTQQNAQLGLSLNNSVNIGSNATIEVLFWASSKNIAGTRMGLQFSTMNYGQFDYANIKMSGAPGTESVAVDSSISDAIENAEVLMADGSEMLSETGWKILKVETNDFSSSSAVVNLVNWSSSNKDDTGEGWYVRSILVYDTIEGRPDDADLYIREDVVGYYDFADEDENGTLKVTGGTDVEDVDDYAAKKVAKADGYKLTVEALQDAAQAAVLATDKNVTLMAEVKEGTDGAWKVLRADLTDNDATTFEFGEKLFADNVTADDLYVRKVVVAQTKLITKATYTNAFINLDEPFSYYNEFQRVTETSYNAIYGVEGNLKFEDVSGKTAAVGTDTYSYLWVNVADDFTMNGSTPVADYRFDITYLDVGTEGFKLGYNKQVPEGEEDGIPYQFASLVYATGTDSGEWKTATVYLSDVHFRNGANGADFRFDFSKSGQAIAAVTLTIGADKTELTEWINKRVNEADWTSETVSALKAAQSAAQTMLDNQYATAAQVAEQVQAIKDAYDALEPSADLETRYTLTNAIWLNATKDAEGNVTAPAGGKPNGAMVKLNGWYCWLFTEASDGNYIGLAPLDENFFADSTSVTYEYDIMFDTENLNDRAFIGFGSKTYGWTSVNDKPTAENFNGFAAHGNWLACPAVGNWGKVRLVNGDFDNTKTASADNGLAGAITTLGSWAQSGKLYVRSIKVFDTDHPEKYIQLSFNEDVANLKVSATGTTLESANGYDAYLLDSADKSLSIGTKAPIDDGVVTNGENKVVVAFDYYLTDCDSADEKITLTYGDGKTAEMTHDVLTFRNNWVRSSFALEDADFGAVENLKLSYTGSGKLYIRGIRLFAYELDEAGQVVMTSEKASTWGDALLAQDAVDHAYVDWSNADAESNYGLTYNFAEGSGTRDQVEDDRNAKLFTDDKLYITVDDSVVSEDDRFVRIDITHEEGSSLYLQYNAVLPEGVDDSEDPYLNMYRFEVSGKNKELMDVTNDAGEPYKSYEWVGGEAAFSNMLGVIKPTTDDFSEIQWVTTSIYLNDAQFRGAANGHDFRIISTGNGFAAISRVEVRAITEADYNAAKAALGDTTALKAAIAEAEAKYGSSSKVVQDAKDFLEYNYRATQEEVDAALEALTNGGVMGDANGDGKVSTADAALVLQYAAELIGDDALNVAASDVNGDGKVTTADAALILQFAAELIETFPAG